MNVIWEIPVKNKTVLCYLYSFVAKRSKARIEIRYNQRFRNKACQMIKIKVPTKSEIEKLGLLADELMASSKSLQWVKDYRKVYKKTVLGFLSETDKTVFVAKTGEEIIGVVTGSISNSGPMQGNKKIGIITTLTVLPPYRRKGIGRKLCGKITEWFSSQNVEELTLFNTVENEQSKAFWESCGFKVFLEQRKKQI